VDFLKKADRTIKKFGLIPTSQRELPLVTQSIINVGYAKTLKDIAGFCYEAVCVLGRSDHTHTMYNEKHVADEMEKYIRKNFKSLRKILDKADGFFEISKHGIMDGEKKLKNNPEKFLKAILRYYPIYFKGLAVYNCFWRYIGNEKRKGMLNEKIIAEISNRREKMASFYPQIEKYLKQVCLKVGKQNKYDGDLLRYLTWRELSQSRDLKFSKEQLALLRNRRQKNFYLYVRTEDREYIIIDKKIISAIEKKYFKNKKKITEFGGHPAYPGVAKGRVLNYARGKKGKFVKNRIFVTSMTHPKDIAIIKASKGIITDEGGILSHAAIVARELKKPCVIGTKIATRVLKDGDIVELDANKGIVKIINKKNG
jgi:phosphohistidine swiveling domain-containing protein